MKPERRAPGVAGLLFGDAPLERPALALHARVDALQLGVEVAREHDRAAIAAIEKALTSLR